MSTEALDTTEQHVGAPIGRPTLFSQELADTICERIADGESLRSVCRDPTMPSKATVMRWARDDLAFRDLYARAMLERADSNSDDIVDIADDGRNDWMGINDPDNPGYRVNGEHIQRSKLRVDARKWIASKLNPRKYGDSTNIKLSTPDGPIATVALVTNDPVAAAAAYQEMIRGGGDEK